VSPRHFDALVVGAGVSGLTTAVRLTEVGLHVRVRATQVSLKSSSAAAGAIWDPIYASHPSVPIWSRRTYDAFVRMVSEDRPEVRLVDGIEASRAAMPSPAWAHQLPGFRDCDPGELPPGFASGWRYTAPIIDMHPYLRRLEERFTEGGGEIRRGSVADLADCFAEADIVINCSGAGARELVPDLSVQPVRGQLVAVVNPGVTEFFAEHTDELGEMTYLLPQGDVLLLGGSAEKGESAMVPDLDIAAGIIQRCSRVVPAIAEAKVLGHRTGIRPQRPSIRLEHEDLGGRHIVHNYGHSGAGVSLSWGCADDVTEIVLGLLEP